MLWERDPSHQAIDASFNVLFNRPSWLQTSVLTFSSLVDADVARDVICLIKCLRMIGESVTMDMAVLMETSCYNLQSPEKAAEQILEDLITIDV